ncbi:MAG: hypothetical protein QOF20_2872 [Acidimicrobiaceae bacterium]|jgi:hypothetical protein|nr:hypothetical protein [Acidimicrobiaceae bacterium]MDQ1363977.1 hypothetical protein [Acidimicrobiaceae bacterium]MDQ1370519.1 hypothetical protein [Acidimicrobiaceae bacterium]MDQ1378748.1 hypothetical protein [Acidimicrobiaceae bacterium]MDQ1401522.1 hypothetical protein [Acidimicrobiaceae bacterium]
MSTIDQESPQWKFYVKHVQWFLDGDVEGLVENDYTDDAVLLAGEFSVKGHDALKAAFTQYLEMVGPFTVRSTDKFNTIDDAIMLEAILDTTNAGERKVWDAFIMRDGKISHHITGVR